MASRESFKMLKLDPLEKFEKVTEELYHYVWTRDNGICQICGKQGKEEHHIQAKGKQGENFARNLIVLCQECHRGKFGIHGCKNKSIVEILKQRVIRNERKLKECLI